MNYSLKWNYLRSLDYKSSFHNSSMITIIKLLILYDLIIPSTCVFSFFLTFIVSFVVTRILSGPMYCNFQYLYVPVDIQAVKQTNTNHNRMRCFHSIIQQILDHEWNPDYSTRRVDKSENPEQPSLTISLHMKQNNARALNIGRFRVHSQRTEEWQIVIPQSKHQTNDSMCNVSNLPNWKYVYDVNNEEAYWPQNRDPFVDYSIVVVIQAHRSQNDGSDMVNGVNFPPPTKIFPRCYFGVYPAWWPKDHWDPKCIPFRISIVMIVPETLSDLQNRTRDLGHDWRCELGDINCV